MQLFPFAKNPHPDYRPVPFWSWNDRLTPKECVRQIREMKAQGLGGFFMHARGGLLTEYLSDEWFYAVKACVHEADYLGMNAWAYDENGWPSGFCSGHVNGLGEKYQQKYLRCRLCTTRKEAEKQEHLIVIVPADGGFFTCYYEVNPFYVDTLDREVVGTFLERTHEQYHQKLTSSENCKLRGFFTDEPHASLAGFPWSFKMPEAYLHSYGDDLLPRLPQLFHRLGNDWRQTRYRFWRLVTRLFSENYCHQIQEYCQRHGWRLTGHLESEDSLLAQLTPNGSVMPHYEYFDVPGMDLLSRSLGNVMTPIQLFSAASQTGHHQILSETFGCSGWGTTFADLKWILQWQLVHGVNLCCQHLEGYCLRGQRKRDCPPSLYFHQPWWPWYHLFNDAISRIGFLLAQGEVHYDTLLIHPETSAHLNYDSGQNGCLDAYDASFQELTQVMEERQMPHHYGDETLMERHGEVHDKRLVIGKQSYSLVILPKLCNISSRQASLLVAFARAGGRLVGLRNDLEEPSFAVDGCPAPDHPLLASVQWQETIPELLEAIAPEAELLQVRTPDGLPIPDINATSRTLADFDGQPAELYYLVNNNRTTACTAVLKVRAAGVEAYDATTGECRPVPFEVKGEYCVLKHKFAPAGDLLLLARKTPVPSARAISPPSRVLALRNRWQVARLTENLLTIDHCRCEVDGKVAFKDEYVLTVQNHLLELGHTVPIALEYTFQVADASLAGKQLWLLLERPEKHRVIVNGVEVSNQPHGYFQDYAFERVAIGQAVRAGRNVIRLETIFEQTPEIYEACHKARIFQTERNKIHFLSEVEAIYLAGDFGVSTPGRWEKVPAMPLIPDVAAPSCPSLRYRGDFALVCAPTEVTGDNYVQEGLPFFAGTITLRQKVILDSVDAAFPHILRFADFQGNVLVVAVNGQVVATFLYPEYSCIIPVGLLHSGVNHVEVTIANSLRNMLGPFHCSNGELLGVGSYSYYKEVEGPFRVVGRSDWDDGWCFIPQGVVVERDSHNPVRPPSIP